MSKAFISYAWENDKHRKWVRELAERLRKDGVDVTLDQWHLCPGDQLPEFMERSTRENEFVLIICTPEYKNKSDGRTGGVGYEGDIMTSEVLTQGNQRKFIPLLRIGEWANSAPSWLLGKVYVDLRGTPYSEDKYKELIATIHNLRPSAPPLGQTELLNFDFSNNKFAILNNIHEDVIHCFIKQKFRSKNLSYNAFDNYSDLLKQLISINDTYKELKITENLFEYIRNLICSSPSTYPLKVQGPAGTGKSTFLSLLYLYLYQFSVTKNCNFIPFYMDLHCYESEIYGDISGIPYAIQAQKLIDKHMEKLLEFNKLVPEIEIIIIIDGSDEYFRSELKCDSYIDKKLASIDNKKKIIGVGKQSSGQKNRTKKSTPLSSGMADYCINFNSISIYDKDEMRRFVKAYAETENDPSLYEYIIKKIEEYSLLDIDLNIVSLLASKRTSNFNDGHINSLGDFYYHYCLEFLAMNEKLIDAAHLAYNYAMIDTYFSEREIISSKAWRLIHKHKSFCNYLLAYNVISKLKDEDLSSCTNELNAVYPKEVNSFMKDLLNEDYDTERKVFNTINTIYEQCTTTAKTHLCYLMGRMRNPSLIEDAVVFLQNVKEQQTRGTPDEVQVLNNKKLREQFLLLRTISISLVYLGVKDVSNEYISSLLRKPNLNNLNRGFHLEYYGDIKYIPDQDALIHEDNPELSFSRTFKILIDKINNHLTNKKKDPLLEINIFTLCSLAQYRQIINRLPKYKAEKIISLLDIILSKKTDIGTELQVYLSMINENLKNGTYDSARILERISKTKVVERSGWIRANIDKPESIADHMYNAMWIAVLYLPETLQKYGNKYNKRKIIDTLFIHDIGEVDVGDKPPDEFTDSFRIQEDSRVKYILMHDTYPEIHNLNEYRQLWDDFFNQSTINARIAKDIDVIEAIYQFYTYKKGHDFKNKDTNDWINEKHKVKTEVGRQILNYIIEEHL